MNAVDALARRQNGWAPRLVCLLVSFLYLFSTVFDSRGIPIWNARSDQVIYLTNATRMLHGEVLYRDVFHFLPPGTECAYLAAIAVFGQRPWIPNVAFMLLGLGQAILIHRIARDVMSPWLACLVPLAFLGFAYKGAAGEFDAVHHWFSALTFTATIAVVLNRRTLLTMGLAGMLLGITSFFTPPRGLLGVGSSAIFALCEPGETARLSRERWFRVVMLVGGYGFTLLVAVTPFAVAAGWDRFIYCTITFVRENYFLDNRYNNIESFWRELSSLRQSVSAMNTLLTSETITRVVIYLLPLVYVICPIVRLEFRRRATVRSSNALGLIWLMGVVQVIAAIPYPGAFRLATLSVPAWILLGALLSGPEAWRRGIVVLFGLMVMYLTVIRPLRHLREKRFAFESRTGTVVFETESQREPYIWLQARTQRSQYVFVGGAPDFYYLLDLRNPSAVPFLVPNAYMTAEQVEQVIAALTEKQVRLVLWPVHELRSMPGDRLPPMREYLQQHYTVIAEFVDHQYRVFERNRN